MKKILVCILVVCLAWACSKDDEPIEIPSNASRPNILLVIADDIGVEATPGYSIGAIKPTMPHLQTLAANGITFDNTWANPVCSPTRATILTGRYGYRTGVLNAETESSISSSERTIQTFLDDNTNNAYNHSVIGKWHLSNNDANQPTQMGIGYYAGLLGGGVGDYNKWSLTENEQSAMFSGYITTKITELAIDWINQQSNPWFCWVAYNAPHTPFHLPPDSMHSQGNLSPDQADIDANPFPYFMAMAESVDHEIGRLLDHIPSGELENTIIIFIGDNGTSGQVTQSPYQSNKSKGSLYQGGVHVPMIISGKGVFRLNERDDNLISSTDLFSTIAELAGVNLPTYEDSYSIKHLLTGAGEGLRDYNYSEVLNTNANKSGYTIRNDRYKLLEFDSGQKLFYDLSTDPYEENDLLSTVLTSEQETAMQTLLNKADEIRQ